MAYVKIKNLKSVEHLGSSIDYITDEKKAQELVSGYACDPLTAECEWLTTKILAKAQSKFQRRGYTPNEAYHVIQSFAPGEVTPEQAHEIGKKLADEFLGGRFEYVIATHSDKEHIHNHIIFNSVSFYDHRKFVSRPYKTIEQLRDISDRLCLEHDLSVIENPAALGYSYKEWMERNNNTSWKADIRKRLNFLLARATSYEEFKSFCASLNLFFDDHGKQNKFRLPGQERNVRDDTLDKSGAYSRAGIEKRCQENLELRQTVAEILKKVLPSCAGYVEEEKGFQALLAALKEQGIHVRESHRGLVWEVDEEKHLEYELGAGFTKSYLLEALRAGAYTENQSPRDIAAEWKDAEQNKVLSPRDEAVPIPSSAVRKIGESGIIVQVPGTEERLFLSNHLLDFNEEAQTYTLHLNPGVEYNFVPDKINPDYRVEDQYSQRAVRGENLLRKLDRANGSRPVLLTVAPENVKSVGERGLVIQLPGDGILRMVIPAEHVRYSVSGVVQVELFDRWNYAFQSAVGYQSIKGSLLRAYLGNLPITPEQSLQRKINAMERRAAVSRINVMTGLLWTLKNEGIECMADFEQTRMRLSSQLQELQKRMAVVSNDVVVGKKIVAAVETIAEYRDLNQQREERSFRSAWRGRRFYMQHKKELDAYDWSKSYLTAQSLPIDIDPDKAQSVVEQRQNTLEELRKSELRLRQRMEKLVQAELEVTAPVEDSTEQRREQSHRRSNEQVL